MSAAVSRRLGGAALYPPARSRTRTRQAGLTLLEIMIAMAIMAMMMVLAWTTISNTLQAKTRAEAFAVRNHEMRVALGRIVNDLEAAYLSRNEESAASRPRTQFVATSGSQVPEIRFSTLAHRVLWADANESEQTLISYEAMRDRRDGNMTNMVRREQRRLSHRNPEEEPADYDILLRDVQKVSLEFWDWKTQSWKDRWNSASSDGERNRLPDRVRITVTIRDAQKQDYKLSTQARILMQEPLNVVQ